MNEVFKDEALFRNFGYSGVPEEAITPLVRDYTIRGFGVPHYG